MTQEEKDLLLKDLCARLQYKVKIYVPVFKHDEVLEDINLCEGTINGCKSIIKPYLRPMSSMTEEEKNEYSSLYQRIYYKDSPAEIDLSDVIDWLNKKQFDYRGLIPMGLALEAPEDIYKQIV